MHSTSAERPSVEPCGPERLDNSGHFVEADKARAFTIETANRWLREILEIVTGPAGPREERVRK
jgi:hypothetical protein